ncbi:CDP-glycerol glycerophosphotransferase family protein [Adlercreutzia equolifaciens]|uniref:CDP-glycerol glycerophosphotransferase family protein n=1 Tax=Adlercreutzia equolifaciens TaxID=446660 RepID=UPI0023B0A818|nr:CDP-glycerol glycerophosphotransferase family protein [Adlercreutzia equolifaciens]MDE8702798.1 CDP-glycerol glycerophosphotransferase family protein [Adlercreutzia equolifaciens]
MTITVEDISWNRVFLEVRYRATDGESLKLYRLRSQRFVNFIEERTEEGNGELVRARVNIVETGNREPFDDGEWLFCERIAYEPLTLAWAEEHMPWLVEQVKHRVWTSLPKRVRKRAAQEEITWREYTYDRTMLADRIAEHPYNTHNIEYAPELLGRLGDLSRVFRYVNGKYSCAASILPRTDRTEYNNLVLAIDYYVKNKNPRFRRFSKRQLEKQVFAAFHRVVHGLVPHKGNRVLFLKENGDEPTDNMAAIRDRMIERGLDADFVIDERYRNTFEGHQNPFSWTRDIVAIARADYIFIDDYCPVFNFIDPGDDTVLTQVWHAGVGFKSVGYARFGIKGSPDPYQSAHRRYNYALIGNEHLRQIYSEVFGIEEQALLATGMPRLDHFLDEGHAAEARADLLARYPWMDEGRVVVFAPTFRGSGQRTAHYPYEEYFDMEALYEMCCDTNTYFVFEMHHFIDELPDIPEKFRDRIFDLSEENLNQLFFVADVLVTDYSSCFYDFLLLKKPVVFYVPDKVIYEATRGVQRTVDEMAPGVVCDTFADFMDVLATNAYDAKEPDASMIDRCLENSGLATDRAINTILLGKDVPGVKMK